MQDRISDLVRNSEQKIEGMSLRYNEGELLTLRSMSIDGNIAFRGQLFTIQCTASAQLFGKITVVVLAWFWTAKQLDEINYTNLEILSKPANY